MPSIVNKLTLYLDSLTALGTGTVWRTLRHRGRYALWQRAYTPRPAGESPRFLGALRRYRAAPVDAAAGPVSAPGGAQTVAAVDLICDEGVLRVEFLPDGVARVRLSRAGVFAPPQSYAVIAPFLQDAGAALAATPLAAAAGGAAALRFCGPDGRLFLTVSPHPCRLTFTDAAGRTLLADADGSSWQGASVVYTRRLARGEALYGLGEKAYGLNRRGLRLTMWNTDPSGYHPGDDPLYQSTPFLIGQTEGAEGAACGALFDNTYRATFDLGQAGRDVLRYTADGGELCYYVLPGPTLADVTARLTALTGRMPLPPRWALGYHQSRWSYGTEADVTRVAGELRRRRIPCDAMHLDIDYMDGYRVFTWDPVCFPDPAAMIARLRQEGFRTVAIIDPGVKADPAYDVCADGLARGAFCKLPNGKPFTGPVWPGACYFPDFTNAEVRRWWGDHYQALAEVGVAGFWNDMNEPAIFGSSTFPDAVQHDADTGPTDHRALHNVYGQCMMQAVSEAARRLRPDERPLLITRSAYAGIQRYAMSWTGDNHSTWAHLRASIPIVLSMGLSGQAFTGPDVAGFSGDATGELLARWTEMGVFLPFFRNHSALGTALQEPYVYGEPVESICRRYIELRYRLLPYLYTAFWQAAETGLPVARPLALAGPYDARLTSLDDEFMCGDALLVAPILEEGATGRGVYLPAGVWYDFWTGRRLAGPGDAPALAPLDALPLYARGGQVIPMGPVMQYTDEFTPDALELHVFPGDGASALYEDDGQTLAHRQGMKRLTRFEMIGGEASLTITRTAEGPYEPGYQHYDVILRGWEEAPEAGPALSITVDSAAVDDWTLDPAWRAPRFRTGPFTRIEVTPRPA